MKIYMICPVRGGVPERAYDYVDAMEKCGHIVHFPPRDVDQTDDGIGLGICNAHRSAMASCDEVHVLWDKTSTGSHFDFGMAFAMHKPIVLVDAHPGRTPHKSYGNVLIELSRSHPHK